MARIIAHSTPLRIVLYISLFSGVLIDAMERATTFEEAKKQRMTIEKRQLFSRILEVTHVEPNEVQRAYDLLDSYSALLGSDHPLGRELMLLKERLLQPEFLIRADEALCNNLMSAPQLTHQHPALALLVQIISDISKLIDRESQLVACLDPLKEHYQNYIQRFCTSDCNRDEHIYPKALITGEGLAYVAQEDLLPLLWRKKLIVAPVDITSYRISQEIAYSLISKDKFGLLRKKNEQGSYAVSFKRGTRGGVHFKGNTPVNGFPEAQFYLGIGYYYGIGVEKDVERAIWLYKSAAINGIVEAQYNLGLLYENGDGIEKDLKEARHRFFQASYWGLAEARVQDKGDCDISNDLFQRNLNRSHDYDKEPHVSFKIPYGKRKR